MKLKSKYNVGDIVRFYNGVCDEIGEIRAIEIKYSIVILQQTSYNIAPFRVNCDPFCFNVAEYRIKEKLNNKAFKKAYAEQCAKEIMKSE